MKKRQSYEIKIEDVEFPSHGIAYHNDRKVLVKGALPGQTVIGKVTKKNSERIVAKLMEVVEDVDYKIPAKCNSFAEGCGGCAHQDVPYEKQLELKEQQVLKLFMDAEHRGFEFQGIKESPDVFEYRNKMEFTFGDMVKDGELTLGMHVKNRNHSIITVDDCMIVDEDFRKILKATLDYFRTTGLRFYKVMKREGYLRHFVVRKGINTGEVMVNIVTTTQEDFDMSEFVEVMKGLELKGELTGVLHTLNDSFSDVVQADEMRVLYGRDYIYENLLGLKFKINPLSFFQTNTHGAEALYSMVRDYMGDTESKTVFDLYCGTGTIGQIVAPKAEKVIGIELIEEAVEDAKVNAKLNNIDNAEFIAGDVAEVIKNVKIKPDIIILDPPRAGVHPKALKYVIDFDADEIIYVSCNPKSLVEDLKGLSAAGYKIDKVKLMDMFPHTPHVETVVRLQKQICKR